jgi:hypothetical protein
MTIMGVPVESCCEIGDWDALVEEEHELHDEQRLKEALGDDYVPRPSKLPAGIWPAEYERRRREHNERTLQAKKLLDTGK